MSLHRSLSANINYRAKSGLLLIARHPLALACLGFGVPFGGASVSLALDLGFLRPAVGEGRGEDQSQPDEGGGDPFLQAIPPDPCADPLKLPSGPVEGIDPHACLCGPFGALAGVLLDLLGQCGDLLGAPFGPSLAPGVEPGAIVCAGRSEAHTSELQSLMRISYAVFRLKNTKD